MATVIYQVCSVGQPCFWLSFSYVLRNFPNQFLIHKKSNKRSVENTAFVEWVMKHYVVDEPTLHVKRKGMDFDRTSGSSSSGAAAAESSSAARRRAGAYSP